MASQEHCLVCFEALDAELNKRKPLSLEEVQSSWIAFKSSSGSSSSAAQQLLLLVLLNNLPRGGLHPRDVHLLPPHGPFFRPLFVTWNTVAGDDAILRGCIGTFEAQPLSEGLPEYAVISALQDTRFPPVSRQELPTLQAAVTLLTDFEEVDDPYDWEVGTHGIRLSFSHRGRRYGSTYLPDVASEQGWTREETLFSLVRKAGWMGSRSHWKDLELKVTRYQGKKVSLDYPEFKRWKDWSGKQ
ncbi:Nuclear protein AMMECR1 [Cladobotryum mycophilum]|uniref:Nuclear protein AMMECR1 n=1 Tax=Cladobotryum mycophilum TaxID=491253 RepID=A0ABR0SV15_9HYPO